MLINKNFNQKQIGKNAAKMSEMCHKVTSFENVPPQTSTRDGDTTSLDCQERCDNRLVMQPPPSPSPTPHRNNGACFPLYRQQEVSKNYFSFPTHLLSSRF